jgi:imidazole glycerol phosphate synthase subunit HisF
MVSESIDIPVLVSGGAGKWQDFVDGINIGKAAGVCTTNIYHFTKLSIDSAKKYMYLKGLDVRK